MSTSALQADNISVKFGGLVAVDDVDVRGMSATEVSYLIGLKSGQDRRKLTIIRTARDRNGMY